VLAERLGRDHPGDLRQRAVRDVGRQDVEEGAAVGHVRSGPGLLVQRRARRGVLILEEVQQRVVAVVADVGVFGPAPDPRRVQSDATVLVDLPRDPGRLEPLGVGLPVVPLLGVVEHGTGRALRAVAAVVPCVTGPHVVPVGIGAGERGAVVVVADRERVRERVVERDVVTGEIRHRDVGLGLHPLVVGAAVQRDVRGVPVGDSTRGRGRWGWGGAPGRVRAALGRASVAVAAAFQPGKAQQEQQHPGADD
jgi:hypothetical protein